MPAPGVPAVGAFASASRACLFQSSTAVAGESGAAVPAELPSMAMVNTVSTAPIRTRTRQVRSGVFVLPIVSPTFGRVDLLSARDAIRPIAIANLRMLRSLRDSPAFRSENLGGGIRKAATASLRSEQHASLVVTRTGCERLPPLRAGMSPFVGPECPLVLGIGQE